MQSNGIYLYIDIQTHTRARTHKHTHKSKNRHQLPYGGLLRRGGMGVEITDGGENSTQHERALHRLMLTVLQDWVWTALSCVPVVQHRAWQPTSRNLDLEHFTLARWLHSFFFRGRRNYSNPIPHFKVEEPRARRGHVSWPSCTALRWQKEDLMQVLASGWPSLFHSLSSSIFWPLSPTSPECLFKGLNCLS